MNNQLYQRSYTTITNNINFIQKKARGLMQAGIPQEDPDYYAKKLEEYKQLIRPYLQLRKALITKFREGN